MGEGGVKVSGKTGDFIYGQPLRKMHCAQNYVFNMGLLFTLDTYLFLFENKICLYKKSLTIIRYVFLFSKMKKIPQLLTLMNGRK